MDMEFWKPVIAGQVRHLLTLAAGVLVTDGLIHSDQEGAFVQIGSSVLLGALSMGWTWWQTSGRAQLQKNLQKMTGTKTPAAAAAVAEVAPATPPPSVVALAAKVAPVMLLALLLWPAYASAQAPRPRPALTGDPIQDIRNAQQPGGILAPEQPVTNKACDFNFFGALIAKNLLDQLRICANTKFAKDISAALDSAKAANDTPAIACLEPGLSIVQAAIGTEIPPPADAPAGTNPTIEPPGLILIFQKFREFGTKNGVASCKSWVNATLALTNPVGQ